MNPNIEEILARRGTKPSACGTFSLSAILRAMPSCNPDYQHDPLNVSNAIYTKKFLENRALAEADGVDEAAESGVGPSTM